MRRTLVLAAAAIALPVFSGAALAQSSPVTVNVGTNNGGVQVGVGVKGQPLVGASADKTGVCVGFSYQVPFCSRA